MIKPVTVRLLAYGQKGNISKLRTVCTAMLEDEHDEVPEGALVEVDAKLNSETILDAMWDKDHKLLKPGKSHVGLQAVLNDIHERIATETLQDLKVAKTCVCLASWYSERDDETHQMLFLGGEVWSDSREGRG